MRLWTVHPKYLDPKGLTALWREALLAQKVLRGQTQGYRNHPQLVRFKQQTDPLAAIASYLRAVYTEAARRGYRFQQEKIAPHQQDHPITVTRGQIAFEWKHLKAKLRMRNKTTYRHLARIIEPEPHPLFFVVEGNVEAWEVRKKRAV